MEGAGGEHGVRVPHLRGVPAAGRRFQLFSFRELLRVRVCRRVGKTLGMFASELDVEPGLTQPPALRTCPSAIRHPPRATVSSRGSIVDFPPGAMASSADRPSIDLADPNVSAEVAKKRRLMELAKRRDGTGSRRGNSPAPGNHVVKKWVVLDLGNRPSRATYDPWSAGDDHRISFTGLGPDGAGSRDLTLRHIKAVAGGDWVRMPPCDWHCVTGWSTLGLCFRGVPFSAVVDALSKDDDGKENDPAFAPRPGWRRIYQRSADGYDTTVQRRDVHDGFLAVVHGESGEMLREEHGGPRLVFPSLYGWKSAKFLKEVHFLATDDDAPGARRGFWEKLGCHPRGRWAEEQRWAPGTSAVVWNALAGMTDLYRVVGGVAVWERVMVHGGRVLGAIASTWETVRGWWLARGGRVGVKAE